MLTPRNTYMLAADWSAAVPSEHTVKRSAAAAVAQGEALRLSTG